MRQQIAGYHVRWGLGSLQEGLLAGLALNALGLLILQDKSECEQLSRGIVRQKPGSKETYCLDLRFGSLGGVLRVALALLRGLGSLLTR